MPDTIEGNIQESILGFLKRGKKFIQEADIPKKPLLAPLEEKLLGGGTEMSSEGELENLSRIMSNPNVETAMLATPGAAPVIGEVSAASKTLSRIAAVSKMSNARAKILAAEGSIKAMAAARKKILGIGEKPLEDLMKTIPTVAKKATVKEEKTFSAGERLTQMFGEMKDRGAALWERIKSPVSGSEWDPLIRSHVGVLQIAGMKTEKFAKTLMEKIPSKLRREAMVNYMNAKGDEGLLLDWSRNAPKGTRAGYKQALDLTEDEKKWAGDLRNYFDTMHDKAVEEGFLDSYVENYLPGIYKKKSKAGQSLLAQARFHGNNSGLILKTPFFTKEKHFATYFDAEKAGELIPKNKDIGYLVGQYQNAFDKAQATRTFMKELMAGKAKDGKPLAAPVGYVHMLEADAAKKVDPRVLIKPSAITEDTITADGRPYARGPENPAFRKWKWAGKDTAGNDAIMEGELRFHPEIANKINNIFGRSAIREFEIAGMHPGEAALKLSAGFKGVLLSFSAFHPVQVAEHAFFHSVNPLNPGRINPEDPMVQLAVQSGLMLHDVGNAALFQEGSAGGGFLSKVPGAGKYIDKASNWIFKDYIPRLKFAMFKEAHARNLGRYAGKRTPQEIAMITADQANAAFGELNYAALGRNKTFQDFLRLTLLAPDFLEARARFAGQAVRTAWGGEGMEQLMAAGFRGSLLMALGCQTTNFLLNGKIYPDKPFSVIINDREFVTRSVPGDIYHLIKDWGSFVNHRLNPTTIRTLISALQHRTATGKWLSVTDMITDFFQRQKPIPFQKTADQKLYQSILNSMGVTDVENRTVALKEAMAIRARTPFTQPTKALAEKSKTSIGYIKELHDAKTTDEKKTVINKIGVEIQHKKLNKKDLEHIVKEAGQSDLQRAVKPMAIEHALYIWQLGTDEEKLSISPIILKKAINLDPQRREGLTEPLKAFYKSYSELSKAEKQIKEKPFVDKLREFQRKHIYDNR